MAPKASTNDSGGISDDFWLGVVAGPLVVAGLAPMFILRAWVLTVLWGWYVVPAFGVAPLRIVYAFGLSLLVLEVTSRRSGKDDRKWYVLVLSAIVGPLMTLFIGWIGTFFI